MDDKVLIARIQRRDQDAMNALYKQYVDLAFGIAYRVLNDDHSAEECVQDAFLKVWQYAAQFDSRRGSVVGWLAQIVRNTAIDRARLLRGKLPDGDFTAVEETLVSEGSPDQLDSLRNAIEALPAEQRQVIELSYFGGLSQSEIADHLVLPIGTVKTRVRLAMQRLRQAWLQE